MKGGGLGDINLTLGFDDSAIKASLQRLEQQLLQLAKLTEGVGVGKRKGGGGGGGQSESMSELQTAIQELKDYKQALESGEMSLTQYQTAIAKWKKQYENVGTALDILGTKLTKFHSLSSRQMTALKEGKMIKSNVPQQLKDAEAFLQAIRLDKDASSDEYQKLTANLEKIRAKLAEIKKLDTKGADLLKAQKKEAEEKEKAEERARRQREKALREEQKLAERAAKIAEKERLKQEKAKVLPLSQIGAMDTKTVNALKAQRTELLKLRDSMVNDGSKEYYKNLRLVNSALEKNTIQTRVATQAGIGLDKQMERMKGTMSTFRNYMLAAFSVYAIKAWANKVMEVRGEFELQQRSLAAILQDKGAADILWQKNVNLALKSPFRLKEVTVATRELAAYRIEQEKLYDTNKMLMDISAGLGVEMSRLILAYGQVRSASVLRGQELRQFTEAGIPLVKALADEFSAMNDRVVTTSEVFEKISLRQVPFAMIDKIFKDMTQSGGIFYRMQEIQAETLKGKISNLKDAIDVLYNKIGEGNEGVLKDSIDIIANLVRVIGDNLDVVSSVIVALGGFGIAMKISTVVLMAQARAYGFTSLSAYQYAVATGAVTAGSAGAVVGTNALTVALNRLKFTFSNNPVGIVLLALSAVASIAMYASNKVDRLKQATDNLIAKRTEYDEYVKSVDTFGKKYDELTKGVEKAKIALDKTKKGTDEYTQKQKELKTATDRVSGAVRGLTDAYPEFRSAIITTNTGIDIQIEKFKELSEAAKEAQKVVTAAAAKELKAEIDKKQAKYKETETAFNKAQAGKYFMPARDASVTQLEQNRKANKKAAESFAAEMLKLKDEINKSLDDLAKLTGETPAGLGLNKMTEEINAQITALESTFGKDFIDRKKLKQNVEDFSEFKDNIIKEADDLNKSIKNMKATKGLFSPESIATAEKDLSFANKMIAILGGRDPEAEKKDTVAETLKKRIDLLEKARAAFLKYQEVMSKEEAQKKVSTEFAPTMKSLGIGEGELAKIFDFDSMLSLYDEYVAKLMKRGTTDAKEAAAEITKARAGVSMEISVADVESVQKQVESLMDKFQKTTEIKSKFNIDDTTLKTLFGIDPVSFEQAYAELESTMNALMAQGGEKQLALARKIGESMRDMLQERFTKAFDLSDQYKNYEDQIKQLQATAENDITAMKRTMEAMVNNPAGYDTEQYLRLADAIKARMEQLSKEVTDVKLTEFKDSPLWKAMFDDLDRVSSDTINKMYATLESMIASMGSTMTEEGLKELMNILKKLRGEIIERDPFKSLGTSISKAAKAYKVWQKAKKDGLDPEAIKKAEDEYRAAADDTATALNKVAGIFSSIGEAGEGIADIMRSVTSATNKTGQAAADAVSTVSGAALAVGQAIIAVATAINTLETASVVLLIIKAVIIAIQAVISIFAMQDKKLQRQIEESKKSVERLETAYNRLGRAMEKAFDVQGKVKALNDMHDNLSARVAEINKQIALENERGKKRDDDAIQDAIERRRQMYEEFADQKEQWLQELGAFEINDAAEQFTDAWFEAFAAGEDGFDSMMKKYDEMVLNMVKKQAALRIVSGLMKPLDDYIDKALEDSFLSPDEIETMGGIAKDSFERASGALQKFSESFGLAAGFGNTISDLQRGIQGMTEDTAEVMTAYLNSIRFKLFDIAPKFDEMLDFSAINNDLVSQTLAELQGITTIMREIREWQKSITKSGHPADGGAGIRAFV